MMLRRVSIFSILFSIHTLALSQQPEYSLNELSWLVGCWGWTNDKYERLEYWMRPAGKMMLGISHTISRGKTVEYEYLHISQEEEGSIYFVAKPSGQSRTSFKLIKCQPGEVIFENPEHDFPQRIIYRLNDDGSIVARIEGVDQGQAKSVDFPMKRAVCE